MHTFLVLCSFALALGHPQGYSYQQTFGGASENGQQAVHQTATAGDAYGSVSNSYSQSATPSLHESIFKPNLPTPTQQHFQPSFGYTAAQSAAAPTYNQQHNLFTPNQAYSQQPVYTAGQQQAFLNAHEHNSVGHTVTKDIFVHVAPNEYEHQQQPRPLPPPPPRKHYRIVFIKAPSQQSPAALQVQHAPVEEKTIIYVLTKKADPIDIKALQEASKPVQIHKPEVYFIKYKTQEEAKQAQLSIQAEYDKLGGTSQVSDEGIAPVTSVIGAFENINKQNNQQSITEQTDPGIDLRSGFASNVSPVSSYLPPLKRH